MRGLVKSLLLAPVVVTVLLASCGGPRVVTEPPPEAEPPMEPLAPSMLDQAPSVRVLILERKKSVRMSISSEFYLCEDLAEAPLKRFQDGGDFRVRFSNGGLELSEGGKAVHRAYLISIRTVSDASVYINGKPYRGDMVFRPVDGGLITINVLKIDDYIKGVLPAEIGYLGPNQYEAYRAQAIASRSYALSKLPEKSGEIYDLRATIMDQVYKGKHGEHPEASRAVDETRGIVAIWQKEPIKAYYCSCCGGHTADIRVSWPWKTPYPYLYGVRDASGDGGGRSFCRGSKNFRWSERWSGQELRKVLKENIPEVTGAKPSAVGNIKDLKVTGISDDGRIKALEVVTDRHTFLIEGDKVRWVLRPAHKSGAILRSTLFKLNTVKSGGKVQTVTVKGGGNGHGVGLCQSGAIRMAESGYTAEEIIEHYYPGTQICKYYK